MHCQERKVDSHNQPKQRRNPTAFRSATEPVHLNLSYSHLCSGQIAVDMKTPTQTAVSWSREIHQVFAARQANERRGGRKVLAISQRLADTHAC